MNDHRSGLNVANAPKKSYLSRYWAITHRKGRLTVHYRLAGSTSHVAQNIGFFKILAKNSNFSQKFEKFLNFVEKYGFSVIFVIMYNSYMAAHLSSNGHLIVVNSPEKHVPSRFCAKPRTPQKSLKKSRVCYKGCPESPCTFFVPNFTFFFKKKTEKSALFLVYFFNFRKAFLKFERASRFDIRAFCSALLKKKVFFPPIFYIVFQKMPNIY